MPPVAQEAAPIEAEEAEEVEFIEYLEVLWAHRWLILFGTLGAMAVAAALSLSLPKTYQASMLLKIGTMIVPAKDEGAQLVLIEDPKTIAQVLEGDAMLEKLKNALHLDRATLNGLRSALTVKVIKNETDVAATTLLELTLKLNDPRQVADGLGFLAGQLMEEHRPLYDAGLAMIDREQQSFKEKIQLTLRQQEGLQKQRADIRRQIATEVRYRERLDRSITQIEGEMAVARARVGEGRADVSNGLWGQSLFQGLQVHLDELYRERNESDLRDRKSQNEIYGVGSTETYLSAQRMDYENRIVQLAGYRTRSDNTKIRSAAVVPSTPVGPNRRLNVVIAGLLGLMVCVLAAFMLEYVRTARRRRLFARNRFPQ